MLKQFRVLLIAAAMGLFLVACGGEEQTPSEQSSQENANNDRLVDSDSE